MDLYIHNSRQSLEFGSKNIDLFIGLDALFETKSELENTITKK